MELPMKVLKTLWEKEKNASYHYSNETGITNMNVVSVLLANASTLYNDDLTPWGKKPSKNIVRKGENAGNQYFLLFMPLHGKIGAYCFTVVCLSILLSVCLSAQT